MLWLMLLLPLVLLVLGFPIFLLLLMTVTIAVIGFTDLPPTVLPQVMFGSIGNFALLAVPFFIFAGELMGRGGISNRIVAWVLAAVGRVPGSMALTTVGGCTVFGAMSGSPPAFR